MLFLILREAKPIRPNEKIASVDGSGTEDTADEEDPESRTIIYPAQETDAPPIP